MYCLQSGVTVTDVARFCPGCGCSVAAIAEALVHALPASSMHAPHTMPQSSSGKPVIQSTKADEPLKEREVSDKPMATNQLRTIALKDATSQGATSKTTTKPNKPNRTLLGVFACVQVNAIS